MKSHLQCALVALLVAGSLVLVDAISGGETRKTETRKTLLPKVVAIPGRSYKMGKTEVTQLQWASVMGTNPSHYSEDMTRPVEYVSLRDVEKFLERLNDNLWAREAKVRFRLPTKEEWEYACCAGGKMRFRLPDKMRFRMPDKRAEDDHVCRDGDESECLECLLESTCWSFWHGGKEPHPVAQKKPNAWGLYDMLGNVAELTTSTGSLESFEIMGGSFEKGDPPVVQDPDDYNAAASSGFNRSVVYRPYSRTFDRGRSYHYLPDQSIGFRLVREPRD